MLAALSQQDLRLAVEVAQTGWLVPVQLPESVKTRKEEILACILDLNPSVCNNSFKLLADDRWTYPTKEHVGAHTKVNVFFIDALKAIEKYRRSVYDLWMKNIGYTEGMANDEATGWLLWASVAFAHLGEHTATVLRGWNDSAGLKRLSAAVKSLGLTTTIWGSCLCELTTLKGRGADEPDAAADVAPRVDQKRFDTEKSCGVGAEIKSVVEELFAAELTGQVKWEDPDLYWSKRWLYTRAGAHSQYFEKRAFGKKLDLPERPTRREFAENVKENLVLARIDEVEAGLSWKLEHGKTRAIYSCDTHNYFLFDYLLRPVEARWANKEVLLNPGATSDDLLYRALGKAEGTCLMLDYDDFNSQHTIAAMQAVIEVATRGAPEELRKRAIESFDNMYIHWSDGQGVRRDKMVGTLPSGHRATSFINTILNAAYIRFKLGRRVAGLVRHTGDDVIMVASEKEVETVLRTVVNSTLRTNPTKQGVGSSGEFLRTNFTTESARAYIPRAISSLVSGNWVTEANGSSVELLNSLIGGIWNVAVRASDRNFGLALSTTMYRRFESLRGFINKVCTLKLSCNGSPVWCEHAVGGTALRVTETRERERSDRVRQQYATQDYIQKFIDMDKVRRLGVSLGRLIKVMRDASYKPSIRVQGGVKVVLHTYSTPMVLNTSYRVPVYKTDNSRLARTLTDWAQSPEELACIRLLNIGSSLGAVAEPAPILNNGTLPFGVLAHYAQCLQTPTVIYTRYPVRK